MNALLDSTPVKNAVLSTARLKPVENKESNLSHQCIRHTDSIGLLSLFSFNFNSARGRQCKNS